MLDLATVDRVLEDLAEAVVPGGRVEEGRALSAHPPDFKNIESIADHATMVFAEFSEEIGHFEDQLKKLVLLAGQEYEKAKKSGNQGSVEAVRAEFDKTAKALTARSLVLGANLENLGMNVFPTIQKKFTQHIIATPRSDGWRATVPVNQRAAGVRPAGHATQRVDALGPGASGAVRLGAGSRTTQGSPSNNRVTQVSPGYRSSGAR